MKLNDFFHFQIAQDPSELNDISMLDTKTFAVSHWARDPAVTVTPVMMANLAEETTVTPQAPGTHKAKEAAHQAIRSARYWLMSSKTQTQC